VVKVGVGPEVIFPAGRDSDTVGIAATIGEHQNGPLPSVDPFNITSGCIYMKMKEIIK
jgi:hypothetical protein